MQSDDSFTISRYRFACTRISLFMLMCAGHAVKRTDDLSVLRVYTDILGDTLPPEIMFQFCSLGVGTEEYTSCALSRGLEPGNITIQNKLRRLTSILPQK